MNGWGRSVGWMARAWEEGWGSGAGVARFLSPQARLLGGLLGLAACLLTPLASPAGAGLLGLTALGWLAACAPPARVLRRLAAVGLVAVVPLALVGAAAASARGGGAAVLAVGWELGARGLAVAGVAAATAAALPLAELRAGLVALPLPGVVTAILVQIVQQTLSLVDEAARLAVALELRSGGRGGRRLLAALPQVWLGRLVGRAERVAVCMVVRGLDVADLPRLGRQPATGRDLWALLPLSAALGAAVALRWGGSG